MEFAVTELGIVDTFDFIFLLIVDDDRRWIKMRLTRKESSRNAPDNDDHFRPTYNLPP
jgi:hypothetical protein